MVIPPLRRCPFPSNATGAFRAVVTAVCLAVARALRQPGLGIDVVHFRGDDQVVHEGGPVATAGRTGKEAGLSAKCDTPKGAFGGIVGEAYSAVIEEALEGFPSPFFLEQVVDRLGDGIVLRHLGTLVTQPVMQFLSQRAHNALTGCRDRNGRAVLAHRPDELPRLQPLQI